MTKRIEYVDNAKAVGILLMIIGHCETISEIPYIKQLIYSFHMPLFFILSGMFIKENTAWGGVKKYSRSILFPYIATSSIILCIILFFNVYWMNYEVLKEYLFDWIQKFTFIDSNFPGIQERHMIGPIWFLFALFWSNCLFSQLRRIYDDYNLGIISFGIFFITYNLSQQICLPFYILQGTGAIIFIYIGNIFHKYDLITKEYDFIPIIIMLIIWIQCIFVPHMLDLARCQYSMGLLSIIGSVFGTLVVIKIIKATKMNLSKIGTNTIYILCGHSICYYFIRLFGNPILKLPPYHYQYSFILECFLQIIAALLFGFALKRSRVIDIFRL